MSVTTSNKRLAKNTIVLYVRMLVIMVVNLYMSRAILDVMGVDDYGIYNVVGGFVTMFSLLSGSLSNAISRFITMEIGRNDPERLHKVFYTSVNVIVCLSLMILLLIEVVGIWFLNFKMQIPESRLPASNWVLQCSAFTFVVNLISIPYNGCIIAHEKMKSFAYISIAEVSLKLLSVLSLYLISSDRLKIYAILLAVDAIIIRLVYGIYCSKKFEECKYRFNIDKNLLRGITSMASWNMLGASASVLNNHGVNLLINLFFGVSVNAARGIAMQIHTAVVQFTNSFTTAINPQITKSYASGEIARMNNLVFIGARFSFYLMLLISLPIVIETPQILKLWLKNVPPHTIVFSRLTIICAMVSILTTGLFTVSMATGKIIKYQVVVGCLALSIFAFTYLAYALGAPVECTYGIALIVEVAIMISRIVIVNFDVHFGIFAFFKTVIAKVIIVSVFSALAPALLYLKMNDTIISCLIVVLVSFLSTIAAIYFFGLYSNERSICMDYIKNRLIRIL